MDGNVGNQQIDAAENLTNFKFPGQSAFDWTAAYGGENKQRWFCADASAACTAANATARRNLCSHVQAVL